jgi:hypothetical protein
VQYAFYGIRPVSAALIGAAVLGLSVDVFLFMPFEKLTILLFNWKAIALGAVIAVACCVKPLKKLHPVLFLDSPIYVYFSKVIPPLQTYLLETYKLLAAYPLLACYVPCPHILLHLTTETILNEVQRRSMKLLAMI